MLTGKNKGILGSLQLLAIVATVHSGSTTRITEDGRDLSGFGNLKHNTSAESRLNANDLDYIQRFADPSVTKELDNETMGSSSAPHNVRSNKRAKRYVHEGSRWTTKDLTYNILKYSAKLSKCKVDDAIERAFNEWSKYIELNFTRKTTGKVDIEILFTEGYHGDIDPFDGNSGTLAHAFFPRYGGDAHFDDDELWTIDDSKGTDLYEVALHEFGHSLGLEHSDVISSVMNPNHDSSNRKTALHIDDILGIQDLYGERVKESSSLQPDDQLCTDRKIDAIFHSRSNQIIIFKGDTYYVLANDAISVGFHKTISTAWPGLPGNIDAAFTYQYRTYFFKGNQYWVYSGRKMDKNSPRNISESFPGIPDNLDAVMTFNNGQEVTFYKGNSAWVYPNRNDTKSTTLALSLNIDAAIELADERMLLFKGDQIYVLRKGRFSIHEMEEVLPRPSKSTWFGCFTC